MRLSLSTFIFCKIVPLNLPIRIWRGRRANRTKGIRSPFHPNLTKRIIMIPTNPIGFAKPIKK